MLIVMTNRNRKPGLFVTGTDTEIGKTFVSCALAAWCHENAINVGVMKPVASGGRRYPHGWVSDDAIHLARMAGVRRDWQRINPVCFREPLAPLTAAIRDKAPVSIRRIIQSFRRLQSRHSSMIVEGIGGLSGKKGTKGLGKAKNRLGHLPPICVFVAL